MLQIISCILFIIISLISAYGLGLSVIKLCKEERVTYSSVFLLGIFLQITLSYLLKTVGLSWDLTTAILWLFSFNAVSSLATLYKELFKFNWNFCLWILVQLAVGMSIISGTDGITTYWRNNWGDGAFHIGLISNFAFGENFPGEYPIFPGERLTYPFFVNLWTAFFWQFNPSPKYLAMIFTMQWFISWVLTFNLLQGKKFKVVPWAIFFGGCSLTLFPWSQPLWEYIKVGYVWTLLLDTIWIPQRNSVFAIPFVIAVITNFSRRNYLISGLFFTALTACHTFFALPTAIIIGIQLLTRILRRRTNSNKFLVGAALSLVVLFFFSSKLAVFKYDLFSLFPKDVFSNYDSYGILVETYRLFLDNFFAIIFIMILLIRFTEKGVISIGLFSLMIASVFLKITPWHYDQAKIMVGIWIGLMAISTKIRIQEYRKYQYILLIVILPGIIASLNLFRFSNESKIYDQERFSRAKIIRDFTQPEDIIVGVDSPNSEILLAGRKIYLGYRGTLWTHNIKYDEREKSLEDLNTLKNCKDKTCPKYLLWTEAERRKFTNFNPDFSFKATKLPFLYEINK